MLQIALGSVSQQKLRHLHELMKELGLEVEILPLEVASGVSDQPITSEETLTGATNRAQAALQATQTAQYGMGVEVGYDQQEDGRYAIFCWTVVVARDGNIAKARSHSFLLPDFFQKLLLDGVQVGDHVREYFSVGSDPITQYVAETLRSRKLLIMESTRYALIYALHREFFGAPTAA